METTATPIITRCQTPQQTAVNGFDYNAGVGDVALAVVAAFLRSDGGGRLSDLHPGHPGAARRHVVPLGPGKLRLHNY